ncbi:hypothetical protein AVEN_158641-1 [Araneus ventricosus]|uniref:C2H2-type domain-containing protein n=1 Tax=Araneus ventricosus TaxID=182803 RepID=A0A4Y2MW11_ARAVE|nr:hypothetical protein AVEN_158641-1 [Araneus ventricosus]
MISIFCLRCSQISTSVEGLRCFHCDNNESRTAITANFHPPVPEPGNVSPGYYVPAADASTQTAEEDFMLHEPTRGASTQTTDNDFNLLVQTVGCHGHEICTKKDCSSHGNTPQDFDQVSTAKKNPLPANPNRNKDDFHNQYYDIGNSATVGTLLEPADGRHVASQQRTTYLYEQSSVVEYENKPKSDGMLRMQGTMEQTEYVNKVGKLDFSGLILFQFENPRLKYLPDSYVNVEGQEKGNNPPVVSSLCQRNPSTSELFQENLVKARTVAEQKARTSYDMSKKKCGKCRRWFRKESTFHAHMQNNCDPNAFKCDKCDAKFPLKCTLTQHQMVHTGEKPFKCSQCDYATAWPHDLNKHLKKHTKK